MLERDERFVPIRGMHSLNWISVEQKAIWMQGKKLFNKLNISFVFDFLLLVFLSVFWLKELDETMANV